MGDMVCRCDCYFFCPCCAAVEQSLRLSTQYRPDYTLLNFDVCNRHSGFVRFLTFACVLSVVQIPDSLTDNISQDKSYP